MKFFRRLKPCVRFAAKELRSGLRGFWIFLLCLVLGTSCIAMIGSLSAAISRGMAEQGQQLLGGDLEVTLIHRPASEAELAALKSYGTVSRLITLKTMVSAHDITTLAEVKAIDAAYPLIGQLELKGDAGLTIDPPLLAKQQGTYGIALDPLLQDRLGLKLGDKLKLGVTEFEFRATITREPDLISQGFLLGPRVILSNEALAATELIQPGSLITYRYRILLNPGLIAPNVIDKLNAQFPDAGWQIRGQDKAAAGTERFVSRLSYFLTLVGLTALIVGGAGIANAVAAFLDRRLETIAVLKCLGLKKGDIFGIFLSEILLVSGLGLMLSLGLGAITPALASYFLKNLLPLPITTGLEVKPLLLAASLGLLVTLCFSIWPLARTQTISATTLFRQRSTKRSGWPAWPYLLAIALSGAMIIALCYGAFDNRQLTSYYLAGLGLSFLALTGLAWLIIYVIRHLPRPSSIIWAYALNNIARPGSAAVSIILALGLGLTLFVILALTDTSLRHEMQGALPAQAPSFFFMDVRSTELTEFEASLRRYPGVTTITAAPLLRGRIVKVKGVAVDQLKLKSEGAWVLKGDRGLTFADSLPEGSTLVAGEWWPEDYHGPPLVSFVADIAHDLGLKIGDTVTVNVLGREVTAKVASLRDVNWRSMTINFVMVFSPDTLKDAPHSALVTLSLTGGDEASLMNGITKAYPGVTAINVKETLATISGILAKALMAIRGANILTLATGILVLGGALSSGLATRSYEAVVLKTYGASKAQLLSIFAVEYGILGTAAAVFGLMVGTLASYSLSHFILEIPWVFTFSTALSTAFLGMAITIAAGLMVTWRALSSPPSAILRNE